MTKREQYVQEFKLNDVNLVIEQQIKNSVQSNIFLINIKTSAIESSILKKSEWQLMATWRQLSHFFLAIYPWSALHLMRFFKPIDNNQKQMIFHHLAGQWTRQVYALPDFNNNSPPYFYSPFYATVF